MLEHFQNFKNLLFFLFDHIFLFYILYYFILYFIWFVYLKRIYFLFLVKPTFNDSDLEKFAVATETATLDCTVKSKPQANVTWFKNGAILNSTGRYSMTSQKTSNSLEIRNSLTINNVSIFDEDSYSCLASTGYANSTQDLTLYVNCKLV